MESRNVRSMNQDKLKVDKVVKLEMTRVNIDILGISELIRNGMGEFNSDTIISTTVGENLLEKWSNTHRQQESKMQYVGAILKATE